MEIQGSNRELEALATATVIAISIIKEDSSETAEVDCRILNQWLNLISEKLRDDTATEPDH
jgi:hypothetical protein